MPTVFASQSTVTDSCCKIWKACWPSHKYFLARKEKFVLPPYFKEVSKRHTFKDYLSFFVVSSIVETVEPLNVCTIKDFTAKLRISNRNHFMCRILTLLEAKYCCILYARIVLFVQYSFFFSIWVFFHAHSRFTGQQGKGKGIYLTPLYHFHPLHRHLDISRAITAESSPLHIASSQTQQVANH